MKPGQSPYRALLDTLELSDSRLTLQLINDNNKVNIETNVNHSIKKCSDVHSVDQHGFSRSTFYKVVLSLSLLVGALAAGALQAAGEHHSCKNK